MQADYQIADQLVNTIQCAEWAISTVSSALQQSELQQSVTCNASMADWLYIWVHFGKRVGNMHLSRSVTVKKCIY